MTHKTRIAAGFVVCSEHTGSSGVRFTSSPFIRVRPALLQALLFVATMQTPVSVDSLLDQEAEARGVEPSPISGSFVPGVLRPHRPLCLPHRFRLIASQTTPQNNPRRPLVTPVRPPPVEQHDQAVAEADQEEHVHDQPEPPGQQAGERDLAEVHP